ncbi:hypothetical protein SUGI_0979680 [Cryptomeria japonica]|uniref:uncharacterized protein LOC131038676 isoform X2 n=1 Tax=Cryptomeria japonica TaxID=3369 RepID=UPI002414B559|nr:uncharacterized protein LOC131038676 isoform X2 [Cryptomeria japonica]GLJ46486.1 hypothetical protein SUGI_0979680 [Cryptomeria japonica]
MEEQTTSRNVKRKIQPTDSAKNAPISANSDGFSTKNAPVPPTSAGLCDKASCNVKRNRATFVITAPSGDIFTSSAKTRLVFEESQNLPRESSESLSFNLKKPEDQNNQSKGTEVNLLELNRSPQKLEDQNKCSFQEISQETGVNLSQNSSKPDDKNSWSFQEISQETSLHLPRLRPNPTELEDLKSDLFEEFPKEAAPYLPRLSLNSRRLEDISSHLFQESFFPQSGNSVPNLKKRPKEASKPSKITSRKLDRKESISYRETFDILKNAARNDAGTTNVNQTVNSEGVVKLTAKLHARSPTFWSSKASLSGTTNTPTSKLYKVQKFLLPANRHRAEAASRLKAMENEQIQASRLAQAREDLWMDRQEKAYSAWLNFVLKQPMKSNTPSSSMAENLTGITIESTPNRNKSKRDSFFKPSGGSEYETSWHTPRRTGFRYPRGLPTDGSKSLEKFRVRSSQAISEACLQDVCLVSDLRQRLEIYLDSTAVEDVISVMLRVAKYVEDGRLKMKEECAIITDIGLKERAVQVLMNYNPTWLRIGLYIVLGHNALVTKEKPSFLLHGNFLAERNTEENSQFLKLVIEKHFLGHAGLSKSYASNKSIDGLYRPGYYEALGKVILKRFFLFVLALDKAKCQSTLPIRNGIDGLDGGSPLLFCQTTSVKSSRQALQNFLLDVMHGEGDLLGRLATIGYQVFHIQVPLADYDFRVANLIENLQDGVILCRLVQVLLGDLSVLTRIIVPSDHHKKNVHNCNVAFQYLLEAGVPLVDEEGYDLAAEDLVLGNRGRILSLLWNIFVHLQMPLLITRKQLCEEITKINGPEVSDQVMSSNDASTIIDLMMKWIQAICGKYGRFVEDFQSSFVDGKFFLCLIDFYLPGCMPYSHLLKEPPVVDTSDVMIMDSSNSKAWIHKYSKVHDVIKHLYDIPEVLQASDFLEGDPSCNERNLIILLTFLFPQLLERKPMDNKWVQALESSIGSDNYEKIVSDKNSVQMECRVEEHLAAIKIQSSYRSVLQRRCYQKMKETKNDINKTLHCNASVVTQERAAIQIQSWWRALNGRMHFARIRMATSLIQHSVRAWLLANKLRRKKERAAIQIQSWWRALNGRMHFVSIRMATSLIQHSVRAWLLAKKLRRKQERAAIQIQSWWRALNGRMHFVRIRMATSLIQHFVRAWLSAKKLRRKQEEAAKIIQYNYMAFVQRRQFLRTKSAILRLQCVIRAWLVARHIKENEHVLRQEGASIIIQSHYRGLTEKRRFAKSKAAVLLLQCAVRVWIATVQKAKNSLKAQIAAVIIQSHMRGWLQRSRYNLLVTKIRKIQSIYRAYRHKRNQIEAAVKIQCAWKRALFQSEFSLLRFAAIKIQSYWRGWLARKYLKERKTAAVVIQSWFRGHQCWKQYKLCIGALINIQSVIRGRLVLQTYIKYRKSACILQDAFRVWLSRKAVQKHGYLSVGEKYKFNDFAIIIQAAFRGWRERQRYKTKLRVARSIQAIFRGGQVRKMLSQNISNKGLEHGEMDNASKYAELLTKFTKINISTEAARTIQQYYCGHATRLAYTKRRKYILKVQGANVPQELTCAKNGTSDILHVEYIFNSHQSDVDKILELENTVQKLQRWWRRVLAHRSSSAIVIQSHFRGWHCRKVFLKSKLGVLLIQACWRSYLVRKNQVDISQQISNLRFRIENSAANVDDNLRLENRLTKALEALLNHKTLSGILHTCATLDMATQHSKRCCERLVAAGAIEKLLQLINETNRSAPHEEVLKHALSTLCNIAHHPELAQLMADTPDSISQIAKQLWRNKEEGFSKAVEILKKLCAVKSGVDVVQILAPSICRLQLLAQKMEKKVEMERRSLMRLPQKGAGTIRKTGERRLKEAESQHSSIINLLQCIAGESGRRRSEAHKIRRQSYHMLKRASIGPTELPKHIYKGRNPFQDCSNH